MTRCSCPWTTAGEITRRAGRRRRYLNTCGWTIFAGTDEVQKNIIAKAGTGL